MLSILDQLPEGFLDVDSRELHEVLDGPTLIHLPGRREPALFVSVLLHGNEPVGLRAIQKVLRDHQAHGLPRALSIFVGNVHAAREGLRHLEAQPDYNRIWQGGSTPEHEMARQVIEQMRSRGVFASVDLHNNTGLNPHYACVNKLDEPFLELAALFGRTVVYFTEPREVQSIAFAELCPSVTVECGRAGNAPGREHAAEFVSACLHLAEIPARSPRAGEIEMYHTIGMIKVPEGVDLGVEPQVAGLSLAKDLDHLNFQEIDPGTLIGRIGPGGRVDLEVWTEAGKNVGDHYFTADAGEIRTSRAFIPAMFTLDTHVIRQDCLGYLMESYDWRSQQS